MNTLTTDVWPQLTEEQRKAFLNMEILMFCTLNQKMFAEASMSAYIILKRCGYIANLLKGVNKECSELCLLASQADTPSIFMENCKKSSKAWNEMVKENIEKESRRIGVV